MPRRWRKSISIRRVCRSSPSATPKRSRAACASWERLRSTTLKARRSRPISVVLAAFAVVVVSGFSRTSDDRGRTQPARTPLSIARVLAARYPESAIMSYIPALSWSGSLRLAALTGEDRWKDKPRREMQPFISGEKPAIAAPYQLTSLAGHLAFSDLGEMDGNDAAAALAQRAADFMLGESSMPRAGPPP